MTTSIFPQQKLNEDRHACGRQACCLDTAPRHLYWDSTFSKRSHAWGATCTIYFEKKSQDGHPGLNHTTGLYKCRNTIPAAALVDGSQPQPWNEIKTLASIMRAHSGSRQLCKLQLYREEVHDILQLDLLGVNRHLATMTLKRSNTTWAFMAPGDI